MAVNTNINVTGAFVGSVGGQPIPYAFGNLSIMPSGSIRLFNGTAANQAGVFFSKAFSIAASGNLDIDLTSGQTDINNVAVNLTKVKLVFCKITSLVSATDYIKLGPQNVTNGIQLWHGGVTTSFYTEIRDTLFLAGGQNWAGWTVDGTHKIIRLNNPTANTLAGFLGVLGI